MKKVTHVEIYNEPDGQLCVRLDNGELVGKYENLLDAFGELSDMVCDPLAARPNENWKKQLRAALAEMSEEREIGDDAKANTRTVFGSDETALKIKDAGIVNP